MDWADAWQAYQTEYLRALTRHRRRRFGRWCTCGRGDCPQLRALTAAEAEKR